MLGYRASSLNVVRARDQAIDLLEVDIKNSLLFRQEDCFAAGSRFGTYI
jgi:hypothetical protein